MLPFLALAIPVSAAAAFWLFGMRPSNGREWVPEQARLPTAELAGDQVIIRNVRNFEWTADGVAADRWEDRRYDLDRIESVWFVLTPFATDWRGPAHAFLSFGFADSQFVSISVEARREVGETYSILKGMLKRFEIAYVVGDEQDLLGVRVLKQQDEVYVYPIRATTQAVRELFTDMLGRANQLAAKPEFYGSLRNNCTTAILSHVNRVVERRIPYGWRVLLPGYSDALAHELGLIDTELALEAAREQFRANDRIRAAIGRNDFGLRIRDRTGPESDAAERMEEE